MAALSVDGFIDYVERSELVDPIKLQQALDECKAACGGELTTDADVLAGFFIDKGLLTSWHVQKLMDKKYRGFFLGKYRMLRLIGSGQQNPFHHVVMVRLAAGGPELLGFLTREEFGDLPVGFASDQVAVYLPMSYAFGGFTVLVPRAQVRPVPMPAEQALRFCVTAGVSRGRET